MQPHIALVRINRDKEWKLKECFWRNRWDFESLILAVLPHYKIESKERQGEINRKRLLLCQIKPAERHILKEYEELNDKNLQENCLIDVIDETSCLYTIANSFYSFLISFTYHSIGSFPLASTIHQCTRYLVVRIRKAESEHMQQFFFEHGSSLNFATLESERFTEPRGFISNNFFIFYNSL